VHVFVCLCVCVCVCVCVRVCVCVCGSLKPESTEGRSEMEEEVIPVEIFDPRGLELLSARTSLKAKVVAQGLWFSEGPVYYPDGDSWFFSDVPGSKLYQWSEKDGLNIVREVGDNDGNFRVKLINT